MLDIVRGVRRRIDLGRAATATFLLMAGIGLDAEIVPRVGARMKRLLGAAAYR
jgi:diacylglycerol kinase family enzyme